MALYPRLALSALACASFALLCTLHAQEKHISHSQLPPPVRRTADQQAQGAVVRGYSTDFENGQREYEVEMTFKGHTKDVTIAPDGRLMEVEEQIAPSELPSPVLAGLRRKAGGGEITKVESITKSGTLVAYEAQVHSGTRHFEIQVGSSGEDLAHEK